MLIEGDDPCLSSTAAETIKPDLTLWLRMQGIYLISFATIFGVLSVIGDPVFAMYLDLKGVIPQSMRVRIEDPCFGVLCCLVGCANVSSSFNSSEQQPSRFKRPAPQSTWRLIIRSLIRTMVSSASTFRSAHPPTNNWA